MFIKVKSDEFLIEIFKPNTLDEEKKISRVQITIHEGKNRQVRKMCKAIGKRVLALHRCKIGNLDVKDLKLGEWRYLSKKEVENFWLRLFIFPLGPYHFAKRNDRNMKNIDNHIKKW